MQDHTPESIPSKQCTKCKEWKPATRECFHVNKKTKDGFRGECKSCVKILYYDTEKSREYHRQRRADQRDKILEQKRAHYARNRERIREKQRRHRAENREAINQRKRELHRERYHTDPEYRQKHLDSGKVWVENNPEHKREYYKKHSAREKARAKRWYAENTEMAQRNARLRRERNPYDNRVRISRRRALMVNAAGDHTAADIACQYKAQRGRCYYCNKKVGNDYHVDHVIPFSRGGSNGPENIVISCPHCNKSKRNRMPHEWPKGGKLI